MKKSRLTRIAFIIIVPMLFGFFMTSLFGIDSWQHFYNAMSVTFICLVPVGIGALTIFLSPLKNVRSRTYRVFMPWIPIMIFFFLTLALSVEGWACWIMILPVFLMAASVGGLIAGHFKLKKYRNEKRYLSVIALLPFFISPIEQAIGTIPGRYTTYTYIDIRSSKEKIWSNVTSVRTIAPEQDSGWFTKYMGFPRPIKAVLNYEGAGAVRKAVFDKGLVFTETVLSYQHQKEMTFTIQANPYDIPSTTMDKHIVVGGKYFDVLNGTYQLEKLTDTTYRLHLFSHFKLTTTFNFYASWWAGWIMKDIQNNILKVIKERAENE